MPIRRSANRTLVNFLSALNNQMLEDFQVLAIPTKTNFRGINLREVVIFHGPFGYSEFSPFVEYSKNESKNWMRAAIEAAYKPKPELRKSKVKINATLPKVDLDKVILDHKELYKRYRDDMKGRCRDTDKALEKYQKF